MEQLRGPVDRLSFELYQAVAEGLSRNADFHDDYRSFVIGSFSAAAAAMLIYCGSGGTTEEKLRHTLHLTRLFEHRCTPEKVMTAFRQAVAHITKNNDKHFQLDDAVLNSGFRVYVANKAIMRSGEKVDSDFFTNAKNNFSTDVNEISHIGESGDLETVRQEINDWIRENTNGRISEMLPPATLEQGLKNSLSMFIINASSMRAGWDYMFNKGETHLREFWLPDLRRVTVKMMHIEGSFPYYEDSIIDVQYLELPYHGNEASLCLILPKASKNKNILADMEGKLTYDNIVSLSMRKRLSRVDIIIPKFKIENTFDLKDLFTKVGMKSAFKEGADFTKITPEGDFHLSGAFHKVTLEVDENGTFGEESPDLHIKASNWQSGNMALSSDTVKFVADRPFMFAVRHNLSGLILFIGRVSSFPPKNLPPSENPRRRSATFPHGSPSRVRRMSSTLTGIFKK